MGISPQATFGVITLLRFCLKNAMGFQARGDIPNTSNGRQCQEHWRCPIHHLATGEMRGFQDIKVVLQTPEGKYLSGSALNWRLTENRSSAIVFDLFAQRVHEQAAILSERLGFRLQPVPLPPEEVYEICDMCRCLLMPRQVFFNGSQFLCVDCRDEADAKPGLERLAA